MVTLVQKERTHITIRSSLLHLYINAGYEEYTQLVP